ncbi:MAG TPA: hypothetical protein VN445_13530 [Rectinemataceae bacterium]|nr:hypothetical protein [Rectinemataceae bacterium]
MTDGQFGEFDRIRGEFRAYVASLSDEAPWLGALQERLRLSMGYDDYRIETPVVYNEALDDIGPGDQPRFIVVADNPGKNEQKTSNRRYLVGQSGKLAQGWFLRELGIDFRASSLIINKTPIHTPKTAEIGLMRRLASEESARRASDLDRLLGESQRAMARFAFRLHGCLGGILWVSGYGELRPKGLFAAWAEEATRLYAGGSPALRESVWVFRHFSMNQCAIEYKQFEGKATDPMEKLSAIGTANRKRILGW